MFKSLRYPGVISKESEPGGGTTVYVEDIFEYVKDEERRKKGPFVCYLRADSALPFVYLPDLVEGTVNYILDEDPTQEQRCWLCYYICEFECY